MSERLLYSLEDAAKKLSVGKRKVEDLVAADEIETVKIGRRRLVPSEALDDYVERLRRSA